MDNCQYTLFGSFAPNSKTAEEMSRNLGKQTILSGSVTKSARPEGGSKSLQMIERPLMTADGLKSMLKGHFVVMETRLKLFLQREIRFEDAHSIKAKIQTGSTVCGE